MGCPRTFCRFLHGIFNLLICIAGLAIFSLSLWLHITDNSTIQRIVRIPDSSGYIIGLIVIGALIAVVGLLGFLGACLESKFMLGIFISLVSLIMVIEIAVIAAFSVLAKKLSMTDLRAISITEWDAIQSEMQCCGVESYEDWGNYLPQSCCHNDTSTWYGPFPQPPVQCSPDSENLYTEGCLSLQGKHFWMVLGVAIGTIFLMVSAIISASVVCSGVDRSGERIPFKS